MSTINRSAALAGDFAMLPKDTAQENARDRAVRAALAGNDKSLGQLAWKHDPDDDFKYKVATYRFTDSESPRAWSAVSVLDRQNLLSIARAMVLLQAGAQPAKVQTTLMARLTASQTVRSRLGRLSAPEAERFTSRIATENDRNWKKVEGKMNSFFDPKKPFNINDFPAPARPMANVLWHALTSLGVSNSATHGGALPRPENIASLKAALDNASKTPHGGRGKP